MTRFFENVEKTVLEKQDFITYLESCLKNRTKGQIRIDIFDGRIQNISGQFQKTKGVQVFYHVNCKKRGK